MLARRAMSDDTVVEATQAATPTAYAWQDEPDEPPESAPAGVSRAVVAVTALAVTALAVAVVGAVVAMTSPKPQPDHFSIRPPVEVAPAPPPVASPPHLKPPAQSVDDRFLAALVNHGASPSQNRAALNNAHVVCNELTQGMAREKIVSQIYDSGAPSEESAAIFVALSVQFYCPQS